MPAEDRPGAGYVERVTLGPDEHPPAPKAVTEVVDPDHPERLVGYGQTGRVRLTTLTREFFMPRFLERDEAEREAPCDLYPWDGVRNVRPFSRFQSKVVEGVY